MLKETAVATLAFMSLGIAAYAGGEQGVVTTDVLNVRSGPSTNNAIISKVKKGEKLDLITKQGNWYKTKVKGKEGWVSADYIKSVSNGGSGSTTTNPSVKKGKSTVDNLNMRSGGSTSYSVIRKLNKGTEFEIVSESGSWVKIKHEGRLGYVHKDYVLVINTAPSKPTPPSVSNDKVLSVKEVVNTPDLNVRTGPSTSYTKIGVVKKGAKLDVVGEEKGWSKIKYNNGTAFVSNDYLKVVSNTPVPTPTPPPKPPADTNSGVVSDKIIGVKSATSAVNVRNGPGTNNNSIGVLNYNEKVEVYSESNGWSKIKYKNGVGYTATSYLSDFIKDNNSGGSGDTDKTESTVNYKGLDYTLDSHVNKQLERVSVGGNVISSSKPRMMTSVTAMTPQSRGFIPAEIDDLEYFLNPANFVNTAKGMQQFLRIDKYREGITASELNGYLNNLPKNDGKGGNVFYNQGQTFIDSAKKYNIDVTYLVGHSMWETGYGSSTLAKGQVITSYRGTTLPEPVTVYNFFGVGAVDGNANLGGAEAGYFNGWTSVEKTIDGSASWIASNYIHSSKYNQNTLYKMKFNYDYTWHQYATDVNWANGVSGVMDTLNSMYDSKSVLAYEVPDYKK